MKKLVPSLAVLAASCLCAFGAAEKPQGYAAAGDREQQLEKLALDFASGAKLDLGKNFNASVPGLRLKYNGQRVTGTISAETHPEFVTGEGSLKINKGLMILIQ